MRILHSPDNRPTVDRIRHVRQRGCVTLVFATFILLGQSVGTASTGGDAQVPALHPVVEWVERTGKETVLRAVVVRAMHLPDTDLAVRERGLRIEGEHITHVCAVPRATQYAGTVFFAITDEHDGSAVVWQASTRGDLLATVHFAGGVALRENGVESQTTLAKEIAFFHAARQGELASRSPTPAAFFTFDTDGAAQPRLRSSDAKHTQRSSGPSVWTLLNTATVATVAVLFSAAIRIRRSRRARSGLGDTSE